MLQPIIQNTYLVEVNLPTVTQGQNYPFLDNPNLRYPKIFLHGMESLIDVQLSKSPNQSDIVTASGAAGIVLTLSVKDTEEVFQIPYLSLCTTVNAGLIREFANKQINLTKSYITVFDVTNLVAGQSAAFNFYYKIA